MRKFWLEYRGSRYRLHNGPTLIGRGEDCSFSVDDPSVSREHAQLSLENGVLRITDLQSSNGTFVNGVRIDEPAELHPDDAISLGDTALKIATSETSSFSQVPPGIEIIEQAAAHPQSEISTEPHVSSIEVLESLVVGAQVAEDPTQLAGMLRMSVDRLLATMQARGRTLGRDNTARLLSVVELVASWPGDNAEWARATVKKLRG